MRPIRKKIHNIAEDDSYFTANTLKRDNIILLLSIFFISFIFPLFRNNSVRDWVFDVAISGIIISSVTSLKFNKRSFIRLSYFAAIAFTLVWVNHFVSGQLSKLISFITLIVFFIYITYSMIKHISSSKIVNNIILLNAINSYLLIGIVGAFLFISVDVGYLYFAHAEHALNFNTITQPTFQDYIYFSFVTLTTLGYGDITPIIPISKSLATALSLTGQLYLTILVAMLVGKYLSQDNE